MQAAEDRRPGLTLTILAVACVAYVLQQTLVVPALPNFRTDLHTTQTWAAWVFTGFLLTSAVVTTPIGKLGDAYGKRKLLVISLGIFAVGTVGAALSSTITMLIIARCVQGAAGAIFPLSFGIIRDEFPRARVGAALGLLSATFGVGAGLGLAASMLVLGIGLTIGRGIYLSSIPSTFPRDAAAAAYDALVHFLRVTLRVVLVVGLVIAIGAFFTGPSRAAIQTRSGIKSGIDWIRHYGEHRGVSTGPVGEWTYLHRRGLRIGAVALFALIFVFVGEPDVVLVIVLVILLLLILGLIELIGRPPAAAQASSQASWASRRCSAENSFRSVRRLWSYAML